MAYILCFSLHIGKATEPRLHSYKSPEWHTNECEPPARDTFSSFMFQCSFWYGRPQNLSSSSVCSSLGITGTALTWFESYLSNRSLRVFSGGCLCDSIKLPYAVPQGSCLRPLLFTIYSSKLFEMKKDYLPVAHAYADNTQLYMSFKPNISWSSQSEAIEGVELCIKAIRAWMVTDKLKLNDEKTEFLIIGTRQQLSKVHIERSALHLFLLQEILELGLIPTSA